MSFSVGDLTLAVIAGGAGTRMGIAKARLNVNYQSILAWQLQRLNWPGPTMVVTSPSTQNPPDADLFDQECIDPEDGAGPLRGILTALEQCGTPLVAAVAVDMPGVQRFMLEWLVETIERQTTWDGLMCRVSGEENDWIEPFPSVFRTSAAPEIERLLTSGKRSVHGLCNLSGFHTVHAPGDWPANVWANLNEPDQLERFLEKLRTPSQE